MSQKELDDDDLEHIERLQQVRESGTHNMFTECIAGLKAHYPPEEAVETYDWVVDNFEYFESGEWTEVEV